MTTRSLLQLSSLLLLGATYGVLADTVSLALDIANADISPDGYERSATLVNATFPAPLISCNKGDSFEIDVTDSLTDTTQYRSTSIHWHGLFQATTNDMDGAAWVNQCPIIPGNSFSYNFNTGNQTGTYWYHSHVATQYCDGLRGPLVIYDPDDPLADLYDVDDETTIITLDDWYHNISTVLYGPTSDNTDDADPSPDATLINGKGRYSDDPTADLAVVNVTQGQSYRFRILNTGCYPAFDFQIDGHNMTVIEMDGIETEPLTVESFTIYAGQRYSVVINATADVDNYWIRANPSVGTTGFTDGINSAILRYSGASDDEPTTTQNTDATALVEYDLVPLDGAAAPGEAEVGGVDYALNLDILLNATDGTHEVNGVTWSNPSTPVLLQILSGTTDASDLLPTGSIYTLPGNSTIEISMSGGVDHPMHLHGHSFAIVRAAGQTDYNYVNPPRRDVVSAGTGSDNVTIRFTTDNAGPWFFHCHIDWHLMGGLAIVFSEAPTEVASTDTITSAWEELCPDYAAADPDSGFSS